MHRRSPRLEASGVPPPALALQHPTRGAVVRHEVAGRGHRHARHLHRPGGSRKSRQRAPDKRPARPGDAPACLPGSRDGEGVVVGGDHRQPRAALLPPRREAHDCARGLEHLLYGPLRFGDHVSVSRPAREREHGTFSARHEHHGFAFTQRVGHYQQGLRVDLLLFGRAQRVGGRVGWPVASARHLLVRRLRDVVVLQREVFASDHGDLGALGLRQ